MVLINIDSIPPVGPLTYFFVVGGQKNGFPIVRISILF